jgi:putative ABC transport system permease protein
MLQDLKHACRDLLKSRWFTCVTVLTLALGIGASTAIFGVVNRLLLNPLPYADSDRLVYIGMGMPDAQRGFRMPPSRAVAGAWRDRARALEGIEGYSSRDVLAYDENGARVLRGMQITPGLPAFLGVSPVLGRGFTDADAEAGAEAVVMLSYGLWQRDYGGERDVIGRAVTLDETSHVVIGVLPPRWDVFAVGVRPEIWFPRSIASARRGEFFGMETLARLRPGVTIDMALAELNAILAESPPMSFGGQTLTPRLEMPAERFGGRARDALLVLFGAVGLVMLVACSNVANILLARGASRTRELSLRSALGASTWRLVRALFAECLVLALAAGVAGVGVGWLTLRVLTRLRPDGLLMLDDVQLDTNVLAFTFGVAVATAAVCGVAPALQLASRTLGGALRHGASGVVRGGAGPRLRKLLVAAQMAVSVVLLVSAGLLVRSFIHLQQVDVGFDVENTFTAQLSLPRGRYEEGVARALLAEQLLDRVRASPGVAGATRASVGPGARMTVTGNLEIRGMTVSEADARAPLGSNSVGSDYFRTLGIPLLEGRLFTADEARSGAAVIVNQAAAQHFWPMGGAVGSGIKRLGGERDWITVVGVVGNVIAGGLTESRDVPLFYSPVTVDDMLVGSAPPGLLLIVRASDDLAVAIASLRAAVRDLDPEIAVGSVLLTETALAGTIEAPRFNMALLTAFAVIALVLAAVGLAAVIGYEVTERTHEIGIRMALGARTENVRRLAMKHGLTPALVGMIVGVMGAFIATQLVASMLYGIAPRDPLTFVGVVALLVLVAIAASWLPARRATRVDPITALRAD